MAKSRKSRRQDKRKGPSDETSETPPPGVPKLKPVTKKNVGHRYSPMNAVYGDSAIPPFPTPD
jgi:hypothetical protein